MGVANLCRCWSSMTFCRCSSTQTSFSFCMASRFSWTRSSSLPSGWTFRVVVWMLDFSFSISFWILSRSLRLDASPTPDDRSCAEDLCNGQIYRELWWDMQKFTIRYRDLRWDIRRFTVNDTEIYGDEIMQRFRERYTEIYFWDRDLRLMLVDQVGEIYRDLQRNIQRFTVRYRDLWLMLVDRALNSFVDYIFLLSWI